MNFTKLEAWRLATLELAALKAKEMQLRKELTAENFTSTEEGTHTLDVADGWQLKMTQPYTRSLDQAKMPEILKQLKKLKADGAVKVKYELSITQYRTLEAESKALLDAAVTTKPGAPSLELVAPKGTV